MEDAKSRRRRNKNLHWRAPLSAALGSLGKGSSFALPSFALLCATNNQNGLRLQKLASPGQVVPVEWSIPAHTCIQCTQDF